MKYVHPTDKTTGLIHHNCNQIFYVVNGEVAVQDDDLPYHELTSWGFVLEIDKSPVETVVAEFTHVEEHHDDDTQV